MTINAAADEILLNEVLGQTLQEIGIPPRPQILDRIVAEMREDDPNVKSLGKLIGADIGLAAALIKTANSPLFGLNRKVRSAGEALTMLGLNAAARAIAGISLRHALPADVRLEALWKESARVGALSGWLASLASRNRLPLEEAHSFGLFRDCGIPVLLCKFQSYQDVLARARNEDESRFTDIERQQLTEFPTDHAMIGCLLAQSWLLPEEIAVAIRYHHEPFVLDTDRFDLPSTSRLLIALGRLADYLLMDLSGKPPPREWERVGVVCMQMLDLTTEELLEISKTAELLIETVE